MDDEGLFKFVNKIVRKRRHERAEIKKSNKAKKNNRTMNEEGFFFYQKQL